MAPRTSYLRVAAAALPLFLSACFDEPPDSSNIVFADDYAPGVGYQPFARSKLDAARVDTMERYAGTASLQYSVPSPGEPGAGEFNFSGGAFTSDRPRNLSRYSALTFWAKASRGDVAIASLGIANDNTGTSAYQTETTGLPISTTWTRYVIPIPAPAKLGSERGLFWLAAGALGMPPQGYKIWFDDVQYEALDTAGWAARPALDGGNRGLDIGQTFQVAGTAATYTVDGNDLRVGFLPATYEWTSSNPATATVSASGLITGTGNGTAVISARLGGIDVPQTVMVTVPAPELTQMDLPVTFDEPTVDYALLGFAGAESSTIVSDPTGGANRVAKVVRSGTAEIFAGTTLTKDGTLGFLNEVPFTATEKAMKVRVYSPTAGIKVRLKVEDHTNNTISVETEATTAGVNAWETLTFNFANQVAGTAALDLTKNYDKATIFFNFGVAGVTSGEKTYYFDDLEFVTGGALSQMDLPVTFDSPTVDYGLVGFAGAESSTIVVDPTGGANKVAKVVRSATAETFAGTTLTKDGTLGFANRIPFTAAVKSMKVRVYSPTAGIKVRLKAEDHTAPAISVETEATTTVVNTWETLTFDFANQAAGTAALDLTKNYDKATIFFNFGVTGAVAGEKTYHFDDVELGGGGALMQMDLPVTFDAANVAYGLLGFGGAESSTIVVDPAGGVNKVARVVKSATAELWAGTTLTADGTLGFANRIPFTATAKSMKVRVYSPTAGIKVRLKVEDHTDPTISVETEATTTVVNTWETLTFNFANQAAGTAALDLTKNYDKASIFFNFGVTGAMAGEKTYYFDDLEFVPGMGGGAFSTITFDDAATMYTLTGFGGAENSMVIVDPTNAANKVARVVKTNTAELWAGTTVSTGANNSVGTIPFAAGATSMNVRVWSPHAGIQVRLKVEDAGDPTRSVETEAAVTVANGWQTLTFNFANQAAGTAALNLAFTYNKASIFFNFGVTGAVAGERTYYLDDLAFGPGMGGPANFATITFDDAATMYTLTGFGGAENSMVIVDPTNAANKVARVVKTNTAELWAGTTVSTGANNSVGTIPFAVGATSMNVRVWSPHAGIQVRLKVEDAGDPTRSVETEAAVTVANGWQNLTFNFANQAAGTAALNLAFTYNKASIFFNFGVTGAVAGERTYYLDDLAFGPGMGGPANFATITFDDAATMYTLTGFGGAENSMVIVDPTNAANKVARVVKTNTAELWAGTTVSTGANNTVGTIPFAAGATSMNVRVWSPHAGIQVRLKVEDAGDPTRSVETEAAVTVANGWQNLTFNFANQAAGTAALNLAFTYNKASIFFNFGVTGAVAGERTYYLDDLAFGPGMGGPANFATITFDDAATMYTLTGFGGAENSMVIVDPTNAANKVARVVKTNTAELWAGTTVSTGANNSVGTIPFAAGATSMNVRVWSPHAGIQVRLKVEDAGDPTRSVETEAAVTVANGWQTLTFNFANQAAGTAALNLAFTYNKASIFFNFGVTGAVAGERTYYLDDLAFGPGMGGPANFATITFDDAATMYTLTGFGGAENSMVIVDPTNAANKVARVVKTNTAELWAGTTVSTGANNSVGTIPFAVGATSMNVRVWSPHAGIQVRLKVEDAGDPTRSVETEAAVTVANGWQNLTFNFANQAAGTAALNLAFTYNKASIFFNFGVTGAVAGERTYYLDDLAFGPGMGGPANFATITFDDAATMYTLTGFGGAENSMVIVDPTNAANKVARVVKTNTAELWAGTTVSTGANNTVGTIPFAAGATSMNVRVWSPHAGIQVRLKVEDAGDPTRSVETEAAVTVANGWQNLTFNFANQAAGTAALNLAFTYNKASIFFNFGVTGAVAGERTYYLDDLAFGP